MAEQLICNQQVDGSTPFTSSSIKYGGIPERPKGADCKSVVTDFGGPNPPSPTKKAHRLYAYVLFCWWLVVQEERISVAVCGAEYTPESTDSLFNCTL